MLNAFANSRFNSQPHKGADATDKTTITMSDKSFNSQPHKGADVNTYYHWANDFTFQLTAPQGG